MGVNSSLFEKSFFIIRGNFSIYLSNEYVYMYFIELEELKLLDKFFSCENFCFEVR